MKKNGAPLFVLLLLALAVVASGCVLQDILPKPKQEEYCANFISKDDCYLQYAQENKAPEFCKKMLDAQKSEQCLLGLALAAKNRAICKVYSAEPGKCLYGIALALSAQEVCTEIGDQNTSDDCYTALGAKLSDPNACLLAKAQEKKSGCLYAVAQKTVSAQACTNIFDERLRHKCFFDLSVKLGDVELCAKFEAVYSANDCWKGVAVAKKDSQACDKITDSAMRDDCYHEVGTVSGELIALKNGLAAICNKVADQTLAEACKAKLAQYKINQDFCDDLEAQPDRIECLDKLNSFIVGADICPKYRTREAVDNCFEFVALKKSSLETCKLVVDIPRELSCIYKLAVKEKNSRYCAETHVTDSFDYRNECYKEVALLSRSPRDCDPIYFREKRAACRAELAALDQNYSICMEIPNEALSESNDPFFTRDHCFRYVVEKIRDKKPCDFIQDPARKTACQSLG